MCLTLNDVPKLHARGVGTGAPGGTGSFVTALVTAFEIASQGIVDVSYDENGNTVVTVKEGPLGLHFGGGGGLPGPLGGGGGPGGGGGGPGGPGGGVPF